MNASKWSLKCSRERWYKLVLAATVLAATVSPVAAETDGKTIKKTVKNTTPVITENADISYKFGWNKGKLVYRDQVDYPMSYFTKGLASADLDGDGLDDVFRVEPAGYWETYLNDGSNGLTFHASGNLAGAWGPNHSEAGDFDQDGDLDVVVSNMGNGNYPAGLYLLRGDGAGGFSSSTLYLSGRPVFRTEVVDRDGDGDLDVIAATQSSSGDIIYFENDGLGNFTATLHYLGVPYLYPYHVKIFDADPSPTAEDLKVVAAGQTAGGHVFVLDLATFAEDSYYYLGFDFDPWTIIVADVNDDTYPDLLATEGTNNVMIMLGAQGGVFQPHTIHSFPTGYRLYDIETVNLGWLDRSRILIANGDDAATYMAIMAAYSDSLQGLVVKRYVGTSNGEGCRGIVLNNFNGDAIPDLVLKDNNNGYGQSFATLLGHRELPISTEVE